jgi:hypothetical protein
MMQYHPDKLSGELRLCAQQAAVIIGAGNELLKERCIAHGSEL